MEFLQTTALALIQGLSEFLPISSSAHLILLPKFTHWTDQGLAFDVVLHLGTLSAIVFYYRHSLAELWRDFFDSIAQRQTVGRSHIAWGIGLGTIPVGLAGLFFQEFIETHLRTTSVIAFATLGFGLLLGVAIWWQQHKHNPNPSDTLTWRAMSFIALAQTLALIPGTSRSGITITAGLLLGLSLATTIEFAFLLSIPVIALSAALMIWQLFAQPLAVDWTMLALGFVISGLSAYFTVVFFIRLLDRVGLMPFVVYRVGLAMVLLLW